MTLQSATLNRVGRLCTGCGICRATAAGGIEMSSTETGYIRPRTVRRLSREEDRQIARLCPGLTLPSFGSEQRIHPVWGPLVRVRAGQAKDPSLRHTASSGGALSGILLYLLDRGLVDRVVQTAADPNSPIENATVESTTSEDVIGAAGSRYAPSSPLSDIVRQLEGPGRMAFVGKPCDVAALRAYEKSNPQVKEKVPYLLTFFCAGIPSVAGTRKILDRLGVEERDVARFRFRGDGWPGFATAKTKSGDSRRMSYAESWGSILSKHLQFRCKICPDGSGGFADIACADAWYGDESGYPKFDEADGRSLVISRSLTGEKLVQDAMRAGYLELCDLDVDEIEKMQPYQARRKKLVLSRLAALRLFGRRAPRYRGLYLWRCAMMGGLRANVRSFLGMSARILTKRLDK